MAWRVLSLSNHWLCSAFSLQRVGTNNGLNGLDRHFRIAHPVRHRTIFSVRRTKLMALFVWLCASTVQLPYIATGGVYTFHPGKGICFAEFTLAANVGIVYLVLPSIVVQHFYLKVFLALRANKKRVQTLQRLTSDSLRMTTQEIKLTRTLLVTVLAYAICWTPVMITDLMDMALGGWALPRGVYLMYSTCGLASCSINPLVYGTMNKEFRNEYVKLLGLRNRTNNPSNSGKFRAVFRSVALQGCEREDINVASIHKIYWAVAIFLFIKQGEGKLRPLSRDKRYASGLWLSSRFNRVFSHEVHIYVFGAKFPNFEHQFANFFFKPWSNGPASSRKWTQVHASRKKKTF